MLIITEQQVIILFMAGKIRLVTWLIIAKVKPNLAKVGPLLRAVIPQPNVRHASGLDS